MKKPWLAGMLAVLLLMLSGCSLRNYQMERAEAVLGNILPGKAGEEETSKDTHEEKASGEEKDEAQTEQMQSGEVSSEEVQTGQMQSGEVSSEEVQTEQMQSGEVSLEETRTEALMLTGEVQQSTESSSEEEISYQTKYVINCKKSITLRKAPSTSAQQLDEILWGEPVSFIKDDVNGFSKVVYLGKTGYVLAAYLGDSAPSDGDRVTSGSTGAVRVRFDYFTEDGRECADILGLDEQNRQVWKYEARSSHGMTELESVQEIGVIGNTYYLNEDGTIVALSVSDGKVRWKNTDFGGASISFDTDTKGTLYLCGYYGPDLCAIDQSGNTIIRIESFSPELQWPYEVRCEEDAVYVTCTVGGMDEVVVRYDLHTGGISY